MFESLQGRLSCFTPIQSVVEATHTSHFFHSCSISANRDESRPCWMCKTHQANIKHLTARVDALKGQLTGTKSHSRSDRFCQTSKVIGIERLHRKFRMVGRRLINLGKQFVCQKDTLGSFKRRMLN